MQQLKRRFSLPRLCMLSESKPTLSNFECLAPVAFADKVNLFIETQALFGLGIGLIDVHLASNAKLWTRDKRLLAVAMRFNVDYKP